MNIGETAHATDLPVATLRYYETIGLVDPDRADNGYRQYGDQHLLRLRFIRQARRLGFSIEDCRNLLALYDRPAAEVKMVAEARIEEIEGSITQLRSIRDALNHLVANCAGDDRPDCPILDALGDPAPGR